jgi:hypothetical protein
MVRLFSLVRLLIRLDLLITGRKLLLSYWGGPAFATKDLCLSAESEEQLKKLLTKLVDPSSCEIIVKAAHRGSIVITCKSLGLVHALISLVMSTSPLMSFANGDSTLLLVRVSQPTFAEDSSALRPMALQEHKNNSPLGGPIHQKIKSYTPPLTDENDENFFLS